jgi:DHA2 family multidrug resistance protein-like MFS transporter
VFSAGTALGPVLGGVLLEHFWWGSVFLLGVPVMLVLLAVGPVVLPEFRDPEAGRLDLTSALLSLAGVLAVIYGLKQIAEDGWGSRPAFFIATGIAVGIVFLFRQRTLADPLIDLRLFRFPAFSASLSIESLALLAWVGTYFFLAQYLQLVVGLSPLEAGMWLLPAAGGSVTGSLLAPVCARRIPPPFVLGFALLVAAAGFVVLTQTDPGSSLGVVVTASLVFSAGIAPAVTLGTDLIVGAAPPERAGAASAISETGTELGLALGIAIIGSIGTAAYRSDMTDAIPPNIPPSTAEEARETLGGALAAADRLPDPLSTQLIESAREAFTNGLRLSAATSAVVAGGLAVLAVALLRRVATSADPEQEPPTSFERGQRMSLRRYNVRTSIAVSDIATAKEFYEGKLGLAGIEDAHDGSQIYACGGDTSLHVYASSHAGPAATTLATWRVTDLEQIVDELTSRGVTFERYDDPALETDEKGIHALSDGKVAWFTDPDNNTFAIEE